MNKLKNIEIDVTSKIKIELKKLNYNFSYVGTEYLIDTISLLYSVKRFYNFNLESEIYPSIANKYGVCSNTIKSNIINSTDKMFYDCDEEVLKSYFGMYLMLKPGPKLVIRTVLKKLND